MTVELQVNEVILVKRTFWEEHIDSEGNTRHADLHEDWQEAKVIRTEPQLHVRFTKVLGEQLIGPGDWRRK